METVKLYDIYGGQGVAGSPPVPIKEEKERKSEDFQNGEKCHRNKLLFDIENTLIQARRRFVLDRQDNSYQVCGFLLKLVFPNDK